MSILHNLEPIKRVKQAETLQTKVKSDTQVIKVFKSGHGTMATLLLSDGVYRWEVKKPGVGLRIYKTMRIFELEIVTGQTKPGKDASKKHQDSWKQTLDTLRDQNGKLPEWPIRFI